MTTEDGPGEKIAAQLLAAVADVQHVADNARAQAFMDELAAALEARGLRVAAKLPAMSVQNPAVTSTDPRGSALFSGLVQQIVIRWDPEHGFMWCWVWPGFRVAERDAPEPVPEVEPMCPAGDIGFATERIANVVRLQNPDLVEEGRDA